MAIEKTGSVAISYTKNDDTQIFTMSFASQEELKKLCDELDSQMEQQVVLSAVATYSAQSGDVSLSKMDTGLVGIQTTFDSATADTVSITPILK